MVSCGIQEGESEEYKFNAPLVDEIEFSGSSSENSRRSHYLSIVAEERVEKLKGELNSINMEVSLNAAGELAKHPGRRTAAALIQAQSQNSGKLRIACIESLGKMLEQLEKPHEFKPVIDALLISIRDSSKDIRIVSTDALAHAKDRIAVDELKVVLRSDEDIGVRMSAAIALSKVGGIEDVDDLILALKDDSCWVGVQAAEGLGRIADSRAVDSLCDSLESDFHQLSLAAAKALGRIGDRRAIYPLIKTLESGYNLEAVNSLRNLTGKDFGSDFDAWTYWYDTRNPD
jgi:HEAT repeat protein